MPFYNLRPIVNYDFTSLTSLPSNLSLSRNAQAYYYNSSGQLTLAAANSPRFDYDPSTLLIKGLLLEPSITNGWNASSSWTGANNFWSNNLTWVTTTATAPDGSSTALEITESSGAGTNAHQFGNTAWTQPFALNQVLTASLYVKPGPGDSMVELFVTNYNGTSASHIFSLSGAGLYTSTGASDGDNGITVSNGIQRLPNSWYRIWTTFNGGSTASSSLTAELRTYSSSLAGSYYDAGSGGNGVYIWGWQIENSTVPTSYFPTSTGAATRPAEILQFTNMKWFNSAAGTFSAHFINGDSLSALVYRIFAAFATNVSGTYSSNSVELSDQGTSSTSQVAAAGTSQYAPGGSEYGVGVGNALAMAYSAANFAISLNHSTPATVNSGSLPSTNPAYAYVSSQPDGSQRLRWMQNITYYNTRLNNSLLQSLTNYGPHGRQVFTYTGSLQTVTIPSGCSTFTVKAWGGGGGGDGTPDGYGQAGGGGGYVTATVSNTASTYSVLVGGGGGAASTSCNSSNFPSGGYGGGGSGQACGGAGGGGGYGFSSNLGGVGGGTTGGTAGTWGGGAGTQSAGGALGLGYSASTAAGSQYTGGTGGNGGSFAAGGGAGWYGGGGGGGAAGQAGGGGGGSSYYADTGVVAGSTTSGLGTTAGNNTDVEYISGVGTGGSGAIGGGGASAVAGGNGEVVISY
jgi:hypothetical protein